MRGWGGEALSWGLLAGMIGSEEERDGRMHRASCTKACEGNGLCSSGGGERVEGVVVVFRDILLDTCEEASG